MNFHMHLKYLSTKYTCTIVYWEPTSRRSLPHHLTQFQDGCRLSFPYIVRANLTKDITSPSNSIPRRLPSFLPLYCESQPHKGYYLTFKLNSMTVAVFPSLIFPFHFPPSPVYPTVFSICFFPGFIAIFILLSSNSNNNNSKCFCQLIVSIQASSFKNIS